MVAAGVTEVPLTSFVLTLQVTPKEGSNPSFVWVDVMRGNRVFF